MDKHEGEAEMLKLGCITCKAMFTEWDNEPSVLWPVTITLYSPAEVVVGTDMLIVVVAARLYWMANEWEAKLAVTPASAEEDKLTVPLNL